MDTTEGELTTVAGVIDCATADAVFFRSGRGLASSRVRVPAGELVDQMAPEVHERLHGASVERAIDLHQHAIAAGDVPLGVEVSLTLSAARLAYPFSPASPAEPPSRERPA